MLLGPVQNLQDARYAAAMGIDYLVFNTQGEHSFTTSELEQINDWIVGPGLILRFGSETPEEISALVTRLKPAMVILPQETHWPPLVPVINMISSETDANDSAPIIAETTKGSIRRLDSPSALETKTAPAVFGYWLGAFSLNALGHLDYEACDAFLMQ